MDRSWILSRTRGCVTTRASDVVGHSSCFSQDHVAVQQRVYDRIKGENDDRENWVPGSSVDNLPEVEPTHHYEGDPTEEISRDDDGNFSLKLQITSPDRGDFPNHPAGVSENVALDDGVTAGDEEEAYEVEREDDKRVNMLWVCLGNQIFEDADTVTPIEFYFGSSNSYQFYY